MTPAQQLKALKKKVEEALGDNPEMDFILDELPAIIRIRTRLGKGVDEGGSITKLDKLSDAYVKVRAKSKLHKDTKTKKSNLTFTGQMLDSIKGERRGMLFIFGFKGNRADGKITNDKLAQYNREKGRPFFKLSKSEESGLRRKITKIIKESVKKLFDN